MISTPLFAPKSPYRLVKLFIMKKEHSQHLLLTVEYTRANPLPEIAPIIDDPTLNIVEEGFEHKMSNRWQYESLHVQLLASLQSISTFQTQTPYKPMSPLLLQSIGQQAPRHLAISLMIQISSRPYNHIMVLNILLSKRANQSP